MAFNNELKYNKNIPTISFFFCLLSFFLSFFLSVYKLVNNKTKKKKINKKRNRMERTNYEKN